jgi:hypothetical protein
MYSGIPAPQRRALQASIIAGWVCSVGAGLAAIFAPYSVVLTEMGPVVAASMGAALAFSAIIATIGVARNRYRLEWVAGWLAAASFVPYSITIWSLTITLNVHWLTAAFISTIALAFFVSRALGAAAHAAKLRLIHEASETITAAIDAVNQTEGSADAGPDTRQ